MRNKPTRKSQGSEIAAQTKQWKFVKHYNRFDNLKREYFHNQYKIYTTSFLLFCWPDNVFIHM